MIAVPPAALAHHGQVGDSLAAFTGPGTAASAPHFVALDTQAVAFSGTFSTNLHAVPATLEAVVCAMPTWATFASAGDERYAAFGVDNGVMYSAIPMACRDVSGDILNHLAANDADDDDGDGQLGDWDAGHINCCDAGEEFVFAPGAAGLSAGLYALCMQATVVDGGGAPAGFFEDYSWVWYDNVANGYGLLPIWINWKNWDGGSPRHDCSEIGIAL